MYTIRPCEKTDTDYAHYAQVYNTIYPHDLITAESLAYDDKTWNVELPFNRVFIVASNGEVAGLGTYYQNFTARDYKKYELRFHILPEYVADQGLREFYLQHVLAHVAGKGIVALVSNTREHRLYDVEFLQVNGFKQVMRRPISALDVKKFNPAPFEERVQKTLDSGIRIVNLEQLKAEHPDNWGRIFYDVDAEINDDIPTPQPYIMPPYEDYVRSVFENPTFLHKGGFMAHDTQTNAYVGLTTLESSAGNPQYLHTGFTGVRRSYRRRGIALALKLEALKFAQAFGATTIETDNEENNPMFQINMRLGFAPQPAHLEFEKSLS